MLRRAALLAIACAACGPLLGVESITIEPEEADGGSSVPDAATTCEGAVVGTSRPCNAHAEDGVGPCRAGLQTCTASGTWGACTGAVGPDAEQCDALDRNCNGVAGIDEPAPAVPANAQNCTRMFACNAPGRGALYFRTGIGFTNVAGANTEWTAYAPRGDFSDMTNPPGTFRISRDDTATKLGPVTVSTPCCPGGCPTTNTFFDGAGQYYTLP